MWPFKYPYTNFHELNLDWILQKIQEIPSMIKEEVAKIAARYSAENYTPVTAFGAKGDGVTNDTGAFQAAINSGTNIFVPAGNYLIGNLVYPAKGFNWIIDADVNFIGGSIDNYKTGTTMYAHNNKGTQLYIRNINNTAVDGPGIVYPSFEVRLDQMAENDNCYRWGILSQIETHNKNTSSENAAIYGQARAESDGKTWAGCFEIQDNTDGNPKTDKIGIEITTKGKGSDINKNRAALSIQNHSGEWHRGIFISSGSGNFYNGMDFLGNYTFGINFINANFSGPCFATKPGDYVRIGNYDIYEDVDSRSLIYRYQLTKLGSIDLDGFGNRYLKIGDILTDERGNYIQVTRINDNAIFKIRLET